MHYVYLIKSKKDNSLYFGNTKDLDKRLNDHNRGSNPSTKKKAPFEMIYYEGYKSMEDAIERERKLKNYGSALGHLKRRLKRSLIT